MKYNIDFKYLGKKLATIEGKRNYPFSSEEIIQLERALRRMLGIDVEIYVQIPKQE